MTALVVREIATRKEVHRLDVTGKTERQIERIERVMLTNMDRDRFTVGEED